MFDLKENDKYAKERGELKQNFKIINEKLYKLSEVMLSLKFEIYRYKAGDSNMTISEIHQLFEDIRYDLNVSQDIKDICDEFMINNNPDQFEDLMKEGVEVQKNIDLAGTTFINMTELI